MPPLPAAPAGEEHLIWPVGVRAQDSACGSHTKLPARGRAGVSGQERRGGRSAGGHRRPGAQAPVLASRAAPAPPLTPSQLTFQEGKRQRAPDPSRGLGTRRGLESDFPGVYACPGLPMGTSWASRGLGVGRKSQSFVPNPHSTSKVTGRAWRTSANSQVCSGGRGAGRHHRPQASSNPGPGQPAQRPLSSPAPRDGVGKRCAEMGAC